MQERQLVEYIVKALVDSPDDVSINVIEGEKSTIMELKVLPRDVGKIIGKHGRIAQALRTIVTASAMKGGKRIVLEILDNPREEE